jgi:CAAX prenyl protease-like protein
VVAPIGEETLFRGFLFRGWHRSPRDAWPVIVTASLWALVQRRMSRSAKNERSVFASDSCLLNRSNGIKENFNLCFCHA